MLSKRVVRHCQNNHHKLTHVSSYRVWEAGASWALGKMLDFGLDRAKESEKWQKYTPTNKLQWALTRVNKRQSVKNNFKHRSRNLVDRSASDDQPFISKGAHIDLISEYTKLSDDAKIGIINSFGHKKKGKSYNASVLSIYLTQEPCLFATGNLLSHKTMGLDISPPLKLDKKLKQKLNNNIDYLCIIDFEGYDGDKNECAEKIQLLQTIMQYPCLNVLSCMGRMHTEDVDLCLNVLSDLDDTKSRSLFVALSFTQMGWVKWSEHEGSEELLRLRENIQNCKSPNIYEMPTIKPTEEHQIQMADGCNVKDNPVRYFNDEQYEQYKAMIKDLENELLSDLAAYKITKEDILQLIQTEIPDAINPQTKNNNDGIKTL